MLSRVPKPLSIANGALFAGNEHIADVSAIEQALVIPPPLPALRVIAGSTRFELPAITHDHAREALDAIGRGPTRSPIRFRWKRRFMFLRWYRPVIEVGSDGVFVVNEDGSCFVPYGIVRSVAARGLEIARGERVSFDADAPDEVTDDALVLLAVERIEHALAIPRATIDRSLVERLSNHRGSKNPGAYRDASYRDEDLWCVLEDGRWPPRARVNAATILLQRAGNDARRRIAAAARPTIRPDVRAALEALAAGSA